MGHGVDIHHLGIESWAWYGPTIVVVICRLILRGAWSELRLDDWAMVFLVCTYTVMMATLKPYLERFFLLPHASPEAAPALARQIGTLNLVNETMMLTTLFGVKVCVLCISFRISAYRFEYYATRIVMLYCVSAYISLMVYLFVGFCTPFSNFFNPQPTNMQCLTWSHYNTLNLILNVSTDVCVIFIPLCLITRSQIRLKRKLALCLMFGLGVFVVITAVLNKYFILRDTTSSVWSVWYVREASISMIVGNLILCWPLLKRIRALWRERKEQSEESYTSSVILVQRPNKESVYFTEPADPGNLLGKSALGRDMIHAV